MTDQHHKSSHQRTIRSRGLARIVQQRRRQHIRSLHARALQSVHHLQAVPLQIARQGVEPRPRRGIQHRVGLAPIFIGYSREHPATKLPDTIEESHTPNNNRVSVNVTDVISAPASSTTASKMNGPYWFNVAVMLS